MGATLMSLRLLCIALCIAAAFGASGIFKTCRYNLDAADVKCYDACLRGFFPDFKMEGFDGNGECPHKYDTAVNSTEEQICDDGKTNLKYCTEEKHKVVTVTVSEKVPHEMVLGKALATGNVSF